MPINIPMAVPAAMVSNGCLYIQFIIVCLRLGPFGPGCPYLISILTVAIIAVASVAA